MERHLRVFKLSEAGVSQVWNVDATEMYTTKQRDTLCVFLTFSRFPCVIIVGGGGGDYVLRATYASWHERPAVPRATGTPIDHQSGSDSAAPPPSAAASDSPR